MTEHSLGPWRTYVHNGKRFIDAPNMDEMAKMRGDPHWPTQIANARLIAAAPDLLMALNNLIVNRYYDGNIRESPVCSPEWSAAIDALNKAIEGEETESDLSANDIACDLVEAGVIAPCDFERTVSKLTAYYSSKET